MSRAVVCTDRQGEQGRGGRVGCGGGAAGKQLEVASQPGAAAAGAADPEGGRPGAAGISLGTALI